MPSVFATFAAPVCRRFIGLAKETTPGTAVMPTYTFPMKTFTPVDKMSRFEDDAWRNAMAVLYNLIDGPRIADLSMGGPLFADGIGYPLVSILGDYWQSVNGTAGTATTVATGNPYVAGSTTILTTGNTNLTVGATFAVGALGTTAEEVRTVSSITGAGPYTITMNAPMYQNHAALAVVTPYTAVTTITHNFSLLNSGSGAGGYNQAQPAAYTWTDYTGLGGTSGTDNSIGARSYAYGCLSELSLTGTSTALVLWDAKATALASAIAASTPAGAVSGVKPQASWISTLTIGGAQEFNNAEWKIVLTRKLSPYPTNSGQQDPFMIGRGGLGAQLSFNYDPAINESDFRNYLANTQPTCVINASNGLTGAAAASMVITANQIGYTAGQITDSKEMFGYQITSPLIANTVNAGPSGGFSPLQIAITNAVVSY